MFFLFTFLRIPFHWNLPFAKIVNSSLKSTPTQTTIPWCVSWCQKNVSVVLLSLFTKYFVTRWNFFWINNVINRINLAVTSYWFGKIYHLNYMYCQYLQNILHLFCIEYLMCKKKCILILTILIIMIDARWNK